MIVAGFDRYDLINTPMADGATFTIWFAGCTHKCPGCQNEELWDPKAGQYFGVEELFKLVIEETEKTNISAVTLLGGEPIQQDINELISLCTKLNNAGKTIWVYTGYDFDHVPPTLLEYIDYIKCGRYIEELKAKEGTFPITTNQKVYSMANGWKEITINREVAQ